MRIFVVTLILVFVQTVCLSQEMFSLSVLVTDEVSGAPINNVSVTIKEAGWLTKPTTNDGRAIFDKIPVGEIRYIVTKEGYQGQEKTFNVTTETKSNTLLIKLSKTPTEDKVLITGEVTDKNNKSLEGITVEVKVADIIKLVKTDRQGNYSIEISPGRSSYNTNSIRMEVFGSDCKKTETIELTRNNVIYRDFKLDCTNNENKAEESQPNITPEKLQEIIISGVVKISFVKAQIRGNSLAIDLLYENVSSNPSLSINFIKDGMKIIDGNGNAYNSVRIAVGNIEAQKYGSTYTDLIRGVKVKSNVEFLIGDTNFNKIASLEISKDNRFFNLPVSK